MAEERAAKVIEMRRKEEKRAAVLRKQKRASTKMKVGFLSGGGLSDDDDDDALSDTRPALLRRNKSKATRRSLESHELFSEDLTPTAQLLIDATQELIPVEPNALAERAEAQERRRINLAGKDAAIEAKLTNARKNARDEASDAARRMMERPPSIAVRGELKLRPPREAFASPRWSAKWRAGLDELCVPAIDVHTDPWVENAKVTDHVIDASNGSPPSVGSAAPGADLDTGRTFDRTQSSIASIAHMSDIAPSALTTRASTSRRPVAPPPPLDLPVTLRDDRTTGTRPRDGMLVSSRPSTSFLTRADRRVTMGAKSHAAYHEMAMASVFRSEVFRNDSARGIELAGSLSARRKQDLRRATFARQSAAE